MGGVATSHTVTIPAGASSLTLTVHAVDDTAIEFDEGFYVQAIAPSATPPAYTVDPASYRAHFTIVDDEWRWISPDTSDTTYVLTPPPETYERIGFDAVLSPYYIATISNDSVFIESNATAVYSGTYDAMVSGELNFTCNSQTGIIDFVGALPTLSDDHEWVSAALTYYYDIDDIAGDVHTVYTSMAFRAGVGGEFGPGVHVSDSANKTATGTPDDFDPHSGFDSWAGTHSVFGLHSATLRCSKGHLYE